MGIEYPTEIADRIARLFERQKARAFHLRTQPIAERKQLLKKFEQFLLAQQERINAAIHDDFKKPFVEVELSELYPVLTEIRHALEHLDEWTDPTKINAPLTYFGTRSEIRYEPKGVCLILAPWNFPFNLCLGPLISCLAAGNTAILKPSEMTPSCANLIVSLVTEFFDDDQVVAVEGGVDVSEALLRLPFDHIFFTGSPAVGKIVMKAAAENLTSVTLELGGKSPTIVDETANLEDTTRRIAFGKFLNNGQTCIAPDYVLVHKHVHDEFIARLKAKVIRLFGDRQKIDEESASYSRIVNAKNFQRLTELADDAVRRGAKVELSGPSDMASRFIHPVILSHVAADSRIMQEEIFGPILPVISFSSVDEVVTLINSKPKPLALYIFGRSRKFQNSILTQTSSGSVCVNDCVLQFTHPNLPFGGVNHSGLGKAHGRYGFLAFSNEKPVLRQKKGFAPLYLVHPPYTNRVKKMIDLMVKWF
jgi:aldehyde dehydrogenase (NAD+)